MKKSSSSFAPVVDETAGSSEIANVFASKLECILNVHSSSSHSSLQSSIQSAVTVSDVSGVDFSEDNVLEAFSHLKLGKYDGDGIFAEHLIYASSALLSPLAAYFSSLVWHGFMPQCLRDCVLVPVPKKNKNITCSSSYRPIALASTLSKVLEHLILAKYSTFLCTSYLQFRFKPGLSTTMCTGIIKNIVFTMALLFMVVSLMQPKRLTWWITVFCFRNSLTMVYLFQLSVSCCSSIVLSR